MDVLMIGSGLSANRVKEIDLKNFTVVAINHGFLATENWNWCVQSTDYKGKKPHPKSNQEVTNRYTPALKKFGGIKNCGYSITLCASYWALDKFSPKRIFYLGCDMNYTPKADGSTAIYGVGLDIKKNGISDPDRMAKRYGPNDPDYLDKIYNRFHQKARELGTEVYNLSGMEDTRLPYPMYDINEFKAKV